MSPVATSSQPTAGIVLLSRHPHRRRWPVGTGHLHCTGADHPLGSVDRGESFRPTPSAGAETIARTIIVVSKLAVIHFTDPACPFAYSASPAMAVLRWRYGDQLAWRVVTIGLSEDPQRYIDAGYTPARSVLGNLHAFARHGMPFLYEPRARIPASARACRAIVATRLLDAGTRARRAARAATRLVHNHAGARRGRRYRRGARARAGPGRRSDRGRDRRRAHAGGLRAGQDARRARREGMPDRLPGQGAPDRRTGALFGPFADLRERVRPAPGGRRLSAAGGL